MRYEGDPGNHIDIPFGKTILVNGSSSSEQWHDVGCTEIALEPGWTVRVLLQHDNRNLYVAFLGLKRGDSERYPEMLIDSGNRKTHFWRPGQWWLHASYNLCEGDGRYNVYYDNGVFQCSHAKRGWSANQFPLKPGESGIEFQIAFSKLNLHPGAIFGIAFDLTDTQEKWSLWPPGARLQDPDSWGEALIKADQK